ncbi:MAG: hypothetical protein JWM95_1380 [Gemmatimonadetes bacterium]|nr:hypothetical protein [Gemmatimonadota bacterium]
MIHFTVKRSGPTLKGVMKQIPFAVANTINRTLEEGQQAMRDKLPSEFKLRRPVFISRLVKIENADRARKDRLIGRMGIQGKGADLLTKFEKFSVKRPIGGGKSIAVPVDAKTRADGVLRADQRPRRLLASKSNRTFVVATRDGRRLILQSMGTKKNKKVRELFYLVRQAKLKPRLNFVATVDPVLRARLPINFHGFLVSALRNAKQ